MKLVKDILIIISVAMHVLIIGGSMVMLLIGSSYKWWQILIMCLFMVIFNCFGTVFLQKALKEAIDFQNFYKNLDNNESKG